jgi:hypothetical protein
MIALIDDPARRRSMGRSAQALARARFSIDVMAEGLLRHLDGLR